MKYLLLLLLPLSLFASEWNYIKPSENVIFSNGSDYELRLEMDNNRSFIIPRDAVLEVFFDTNVYFTAKIYRGDTNALIWTGTSTFIPDNYRKYYGVRQTAANAFAVHETNIVQPVAELFVQYNATPNVWVQNTELGYPIDVNVASGGTGGSSLSVSAQLEIFWVGFLLQIAFELTGLTIRFVRNLRASGNIDAS